ASNLRSVLDSSPSYDAHEYETRRLPRISTFLSGEGKCVMRRIGFAVALILASLPFAASAQAPAPSSTSVAAQSTPVVGTFDKSSIVIAFYCSPLWAAILADRRFELNAVKAANHTARAKELEKYGGESQDLAMQQLAGKAPTDNILAVLQPEI